MELSINYILDDQNKLTIEDNTKLFHLYTDELHYYDYKNLPKYSDTKSMIIVVKKDASGDLEKDKIEKIDYFDHEHIGPNSDLIDVKFNQDGYYKIFYFVLPTEDWLYWHHTRGVDVLKKYDVVFYLANDGKIYNLEDITRTNPITPEQFMYLNLDYMNTPITRSVKDIFTMANLWCCYYSYARQLFDALLKKCVTHEYDDIIYKRDFVFMTIHILKYLVEYEQFLEAQRILDILNGCGGFCSSVDNVKVKAGCGCLKV